MHVLFSLIFMARTIPLSHGFELFVSLTRVCVVYVVKEVTSFSGAGGLAEIDQSINGRGA